MKRMILIAALVFIGTLSATTAPTPKGFIADWLICGPFPSYEGKSADTGLENDFLGGEDTAAPCPGQSFPAVFKADNSKLILGADLTNEWGFREDLPMNPTWRVMHFDKPDQILADHLFPPISDRFAFYAACWIESPAAQEVRVRLGCDDDHKLYLNGVLLAKSASSQAIRPDTFVYPAKLKPGLNFLLLKVVDRLFDSGFCLALSDPDGKPLNNVKGYTDSPARKLGADDFLNGFGIKFTFSDRHLFDDRQEQSCRIRLFAPDSAEYELEVGGKKQPLRNGQEAVWDLKLPSGVHPIEAIVRDRDGRETTRFTRTVTIHSRKKIEEQLQNQRVEIQEIDAALPGLNREIAKEKLRVEQAKQRVAAALASAEEQYATMRTQAQANAAPSIEEPFRPKSCRTRILLNGMWKAGPRADRCDQTLRLPHKMTGNFFRAWYYPIEPVDSPHSPKFRNLKGYEKYELEKLMELVTARHIFFEKEITVDDPSKAWYFICTAIIGKVTLFCNGTPCGTYHGTVGLVEIPLAGLREGKNRLVLEYTDTPMITTPNSEYYGILGNLYLEQRSRVHTADIGIKSSWRNAALSLDTELFNGEQSAQKFRLEQYAVRDGKIRFRLPPKEGVLEPGKTTVVKNEAKWRNPELWSHAHPALYSLVSDLYVDGRLADRRSDSFGFREFWIHGVDFFLNGKRIILQGDVGIDLFGYEKCRDVIFPLLRQEGINLLRLHDSRCHMLGEVADAADRHGMFLEAQTYPQGDFSRKADSSLMKEFKTSADWKKSDWHAFNTENYRRWHRLMRNHPSVLIWSIDNESFTPGCESRGLEKRNILVDDIVNSYYEEMHQLDPALVITRDGDVTTYGPDRRNFHASTPANVHYPEFHPDRFINDWQHLFHYRPAIYGETLYCSYVWGGWPGATPKLVAQKAAMVRDVAARYRELKIPAPIYMGVGLDGFLELKPDGSGSAWGVKEVPRKLELERPADWRNGIPADHYPFVPVPWPSMSGRGMRPEFLSNSLTGFGFRGINCFFREYPVCVRNAVNRAYRETLIPQPPLADPGIAEAIVVTEPDGIVFTTLPDGSRYGIVADAAGKAYFHLDAGRYRFESNGLNREVELKSKQDYAAKPGFEEIPTINLKEGK